MTLIVPTKHHGELDCGFYSAFTQFYRIGDYAVATKHLCQLTKQIAENPNLLEGRLLSYNLEKFWEKEQEHKSDIMQTFQEISESYLPELAESEMHRQLESSQREITLEDEINNEGKGKLVLVRFNRDLKSVNLGKYLIPEEDFAVMTIHAAKGGFFGWLNGVIPEFAQEAVNAIQNSKNPLYEKFKKPA